LLPGGRRLLPGWLWLANTLTPVVDTDRIIAFFESGDLVALSREGKQLWKRCLSQDCGRFQNEFGLGASSLQKSDMGWIECDPAGVAEIDG
jgi:outer membrane protein assembly factor BamB